jgi:hypothetical protein
VIAGAKKNMSLREAQGLEELIADYQDIFETKRSDYGSTEKVYNGIDTGDAWSICQPARRLPLVKPR